MVTFFGQKNAVSLRNCVGWSPIYTPDGTPSKYCHTATIVKIYFANSKTVDIRASHVYKNIHENYFYYPGLAAGDILQNPFFAAPAKSASKFETLAPSSSQGPQLS